VDERPRELKEIPRESMTPVEAPLHQPNSGEVKRVPDNFEQVEYVRRQLAQGDYRVDPHQVAAAMLDRIDAHAVGLKVVSGPEGGHVLREAMTYLRTV